MQGRFMAEIASAVFERCSLLAQSCRELSPSWPHYIIVDKNDLSLFRQLSSPNTIIIDTRELLDPWLRRLPGNSGIWWSKRAPPARGWITQQLRKLAIDRVAQEDNILCCDSDMVFLKRFDSSNFEIDRRLGLLDVGYEDGNCRQWTTRAHSLLGIQAISPVYRGHVGTLIGWRREVLKALHDRIEASTSMPWQEAISRHRTISEYITYGVFVRRILGYEASLHAPSAVDLVKQSWGLNLDSEAKLAQFFSHLGETQIAAMVHSKDRIPTRLYRRHVESCWANNA